MDELDGILTVYEMRTEQDDATTSEATFNASKKTHRNKQESK